MDQQLIEAVRAWQTQDPAEDTRAELQALLDAGDDAELARRFAGRLQFGTAGLRGPIEAGPMGMNRVTVGRAAAGLAAYLAGKGLQGRPVVIGFDARHGSHDFADDTAQILAGAGFAAELMPAPLPTPLLAYSIRARQAVAGVMVTASHNPAADNGYKVYLGDGVQIVPPADAEIAAAIDAVGPLGQVPRSDGYLTLDAELIERYVDSCLQVVAAGPDPRRRELRIAFTPMHGVGGALFCRVLDRAGFAAPVCVSEQFEPDPAFPTVPFPNPEEAGALDLAMALAKREDSDLIIAVDPDADRCAVAVPDAGIWRRLTGDEVGAILGERIAADGGTGTLGCSLVSSGLLAAIAAAHGRRFTTTLTGFKWLGRIPDLAFSYEEALGYCVHPEAISDKDGISAGLLVAQIAAELKAEGRTLLDVLDDQTMRYGPHVTDQLSIRVAELSDREVMLGRLRAEPPAALGGVPVAGVEDLAAGVDGLPPTEGLRLTFADGRGRVVIRPSGTEPKLKCYIEVVAAPNPDRAVALDAREQAREQVAAVIAELRERCTA